MLLSTHRFHIERIPTNWANNAIIEEVLSRCAMWEQQRMTKKLQKKKFNKNIQFLECET